MDWSLVISSIPPLSLQCCLNQVSIFSGLFQTFRSVCSCHQGQSFKTFQTCVDIAKVSRKVVVLASESSGWLVDVNLQIGCESSRVLIICSSRPQAFEKYDKYLHHHKIESLL